MFYQLLFTIFLLQAHACLASRGLGLVHHHARLINYENSLPSKELKTASPAMDIQMDSEQTKPAEMLMQGMVTETRSVLESKHERYKADTEQRDEVVDVKDYVKSRGKALVTETRSVLESKHERYKADTEQRDEVVDVKDYVKSRGKAPIHN